MISKGRSFKLGITTGLLVALGIFIGVVLTMRMDWVSTAQSESVSSSSTANKQTKNFTSPKNVFVPIVKSASPAVVNISTSRTVDQKSFRSPLMDDPFFRRFFGDQFPNGGGHNGQGNKPRQKKESSLGSGVIVSSSGYIITNNHVVAKADEIKVVMNDKREFIGKVIGTDPKTDLAVIKIDAKDLPSVPWGNSDGLEVGEYVLAIGNPFGLNQTITMGIVSAVGRANVGIADYEDFIQTDAAINPGNSGGALVNVNGELVGINTAIFSRSGGYMGIGFAVPSNMAKVVMNSLIKSGKVVRGWLGVSIQKVTKDLAKQFDLKDAKGALIGEVMDGTPAKAGGIKDGDVIISFDGKPVDSPTTLRNVVAQTEVGKKADVVVVRDGKRKTLKVKIGEQPKDMASSGSDDSSESDNGESSALAGLEVRTLTKEIAAQIGVPEGTKGVVVASVDPNSAAQEAGIRRGDVIVELNRKKVRKLSDFKKIAKNVNEKRNILLRVKRKGGKFFIIIKPKK